jgi:16S rRNA G966 N2-methylase RsmD
MRVIAGSARGRKIKSVPGDSTRPITDRVKESLFSIIGPEIQDSNFLDLFAGTGSVGIEALSRGAKAALFNVIRGDALSILEEPAIDQFDYIYIAPPQYQGVWKTALELVDIHRDWLSPDAWVIVQIHPREVEKLELNYLVEFDRRNYGSTLLIFFQVEDP